MTPILNLRTCLLLGAAAFCLGSAAPAMAVPAGGLTQAFPVAAPQQAMVHKVQDRRWRRGRHGNRFRDRRRGFSHYYDGYYYAVPWWAEDYYDDYDDEPDYGGGRGGGRHEEWCADRYKSYKPRTNTWTDYDLNTRECISPYS